MRTQGPKAAHWNVGARQHAAERVPLSKPQKLRNERTPSRDGGGDIARRTEHHGGVVELRRGRQPKRAHTSLPAIESTAMGQSRSHRKGLRLQLQPHTADGGSSAGSLEKPAMLARRASTATTLSRRRRTEAAVELAPLHRRPRCGSTSLEKPATLASRARPTALSRRRGIEVARCSHTCTPAPRTAVVAPA